MSAHKYPIGTVVEWDNNTSVPVLDGTITGYVDPAETQRSFEDWRGEWTGDSETVKAVQERYAQPHYYVQLHVTPNSYQLLPEPMLRLIDWDAELAAEVSA
jgi:hypothetical protein